MKKDQVVILEKRGSILINGDDSEDFLQNIITNDIKKVSKTNSILPNVFIFFPNKPRSVLIKLPLI